MSIFSYIAIFVANVIGMWFIFQKIDVPQIKSLIPIYRDYLLFKTIGKNKLFIFWFISLSAMVGGALFFLYRFEIFSEHFYKLNKTLLDNNVNDMSKFIITPSLEEETRIAVYALVFMAVSAIIFLFMQIIFSRRMALCFGFGKLLTLCCVLCPSAAFFYIGTSKKIKFSNANYVYIMR